ncbi:hypothetical protein B0H34DRAFT_786336 [Crassisporium funariophilum]|nr:hypothetical protein B0H34DRAFT_786336 [Crassisporium funariophilum]
MEHQGLLSWANSVRLTMASDPGRQLFKDQVQTHGFLFLDDYLDNIVSGHKQDPLIELVKTPGRKKAIAKKPKLMASKLGNAIPLSLEDDAENIPVSNTKLSLAKAEKTNGGKKSSEPITSKAYKPNSTVGGDEISQRPALLPIQLSNLSDDTSVGPLDYPSVSPQTVFEEQPAPAGLLPPSNSDNDLSVIAEDEEPSERSRVSSAMRVESLTRTSLTMPPPPEASNTSARLSSLKQLEHMPQEEENLASISSMDTFHSVPLNSPVERAISPAQKLKVSAVEDLTGPLSQASTSQLSNDTQDHVMDDILQTESRLSNQKSIDKVVTPSFPTLPEPMPMRKSMRAPRDPSMNAVLLGAATPGAPVGGKRTSWLMKAREVKALEITSKKSFAPLKDAGGMSSQGTKRKSGDPSSLPLTRTEDERQSKVAKTLEGETAPRSSKELPSMKSPDHSPIVANVFMEEQTNVFQQDTQEGVLDRLKKTVEGFGVRVGKSMGKSLGGGAAIALAEARAAAEAKVAERDRKEEEMTMAMALPAQAIKRDESAKRDNEGRLSISDLFPTDGHVKEKHKVPEKPFQITPSVGSAADVVSKQAATSRTSTSTTPPTSPPAHLNSFTLPSGPVFNKPPPVFVPPVQVATKPTPSTFAQDIAKSKYNVPTSMALGFSPRLPSSSATKGKSIPLTVQSTLESIQSDGIFDREDVPNWMPSQDTQYTSAYGSQSQQRSSQVLDEDDSWPMDEKIAAGVQWTFGASKEDSMTWSTLPSQSQRADTGPVTKTSPMREDRSMKEPTHANQSIPGTFDIDMEDEYGIDEELVPRDAELEQMVIGAPKFTASVLGAKQTRPQSQMSMASSESSQSQMGFLGQASKLFSNALGTSKKGKQPEVKKVLQMAAVAAKKQQEEADKKAARLKEMESRRQLAIQRKAEEEKAASQEEARKMKEEVERRKKEREEYTDKRPLKSAASKKEDDTMKKRKLEAEKKQELKKPAASVMIGKAHLKSALKQPSGNTYGVSIQAAASTSNLTAEASFSGYKAKSQISHKVQVDDEVSQPSMLVQSQMAARAKAQIEAAKPTVTSESIELPDINSEYSDSDDEDRPRAFDPPGWAQSPELRQALEMQSTINPDDIFGAVRPLRMEEIFKTRTSRFRARTSSANWTGTDRLTIQEEKDYARRMGFK